MDSTVAQPATPRTWTPLLVLILAGLTACGPGPTTDPAVVSVSVDPSSLTLSVGATATLAATIHATGPASRSVTWTSDDETIAEVDGNGTVTAIAVGTATITATSVHDPGKDASAAVTVSSGGPATLDWTLQFGTSANDLGRAVAVDSQGFIIVVGSTKGGLGGPNVGDHDAFVRKYAPDGEELWTRQFGTGAWEEARAVATDEADNILVVGTTWGSLGGTHRGNGDVFVRQYSHDGDEGWTEQFGSPAHESGFAIVIDGGGGIVVAGRGAAVPDGNVTGNRGFVRRYSRVPGGGVAEDWTFDAKVTIQDLAVDASGDIIAVGTGSRSELGIDGDHGSEVYVAKLTPAGDAVWTALFGTGEKSHLPNFERDPVPATRRPTELWENLRGFEERGLAVAVDPAGNLFVTGYVGGFDTGTGNASQRAFVLKLTPAGVEAWAVLFGDEYATYGNAIAIAPSGDVIFTGNTASFYGERTPPGTETFTRRLAPDGTLLWDDTFGESGWDTSFGLAIDAQGNVYTVGETLGDLGAPNVGASDVFVRKYTP